MTFPAGVYLFKASNGNTRIFKIFSKLRIKHQKDIDVDLAPLLLTFEQISHIVLVFLLLTMND